ncbi:MAG: aminotransferase class IV [Deltaproteobacteria bacterium]|nr:aminotransferase class IV [Deltaproteobacteria bacterium]
MSFIYVNGHFHPGHEAVIPAPDRGFLLGLAVFETMRAYQGRVFLLDRHMARIAAALDHLRITPPEGIDGLRRAVEECVRRNGGGDGVVRLTVSPGPAPDERRPAPEPTRVVFFGPLDVPRPDVYESGVSTLTAPHPSRASRPSAGMKAASYMDLFLIRERARAEGAYEVILFDDERRVVEGCATNVFTVKDGVLRTPPPARGGLAGVTRAYLIERAQALGVEVEESDIREADLEAADEIFVSNSVVELIHVAFMTDLNFIKNKTPEMTRRLRDDYRAAATA